ncbi:zinc finger, C3HC4 type [Dictyocaulus viviparus]|uniref:E3 ubiquitin-protein ligase n=1 Tax=Dictyocaulus viviparus TaxID=29172 RepID=A0A0D8XFM7_DICVI|nr:zinc finger, C3HC4 type [Dictyocaulus viviparus]
MHEFTIGPIGNWNGTINIITKLGNIAEETVDVICVSVSDSFKHSHSFWNALTKVGGRKEYTDAFTKAKKALSSCLSPGEILVVDVSKTKLPMRFVFLVVYPDMHHLEKAYRSIFREAIARQCTSIAIPGLGSGNIGNSVYSTAVTACSVIYETAIGDALGSIKEQFIAQLHVKFGMYTAKDSMFTIPGKFIIFCFSFSERGCFGPMRVSDNMLKFLIPQSEVVEDDCSICISRLTNGESQVFQLPCAHQYHAECFAEYLRSPGSKKWCLLCRQYFELPLGDQPNGAQMFIRKNHSLKLPGHEDSSFTYEILYKVANGVQEASHPRPGKPFTGTRRKAYVPGTPDGSKVLRLLKFAFERRLIFTVGDSLTTGKRDVVVWNNIHHKTNVHGGPQNYGFPDPEYLRRVREDLTAMGIYDEMLAFEEEDQ